MKRILTGLLLGFSTLHPTFAQELPSKAIELPEVQAFVQEMAQKHHMDEATLTGWFETAKFQPKILEAISKPYEKKPWYQYKKLFVTESHVNDGIKFWALHKEALSQAEKKYGVPAEIIVAIIGVETRYGKHKGFYPILDALSTLAFEYPPRATFFKSELEQLLLLAHEQELDPTKMVSSYAGAIGYPQFIPSSYRAYAVDFNGARHADLINNPKDAIGSVANYFKSHGWEPGKAIAMPAKADPSKVGQIEQSPNNPKPNYTLGQLNQFGVQVPLKDAKQKQEKMAFLSFDEEQGYDYWVGFQNFYVITRYNHSNLYAMAVYQLAQKLKQEALAKALTNSKTT